jgi:hypothetical protein
VAVPLTERDREKFHSGNWLWTNDPYGSWWLGTDPRESFSSEAEMRSALAIRTEWNGDHGMVSMVLHEPIAVLMGMAASQHSVDNERIFAGGGFQIYWPYARQSSWPIQWSPLQWEEGTP